MAVCGQLEFCPSAAAAGRLGAHIQWYCVVPNKTTFAGLISKLGPELAGTHLEVCTANQRSLETVREYCNDPHKDSADDGSDMFSYGIFPSGAPGNQKGATLEQFRELITSGITVKDLILDGQIELGMVNGSLRLLEKCERLFQPGRGSSHTPRVVVLYSKESGTGKSHYVHNGGLERRLEAAGGLQVTGPNPSRRITPERMPRPDAEEEAQIANAVLTSSQPRGLSPYERTHGAPIDFELEELSDSDEWA